MWSAYQFKVIQAMKDGNYLYSLSGIHAHCWIRGVKPRPSFATVQRLDKGGMLSKIKDDYTGSIWEWSGKEA